METACRGPAAPGRRHGRWPARLLLLLSFCAAPLIGLAQDAPYQWKNVAIGGGGFVTGLSYHPAERGLAYARTDVGGAYRWDDAAARWIALTDHLGADDANLMGIESLALDPTDPNRLYLAAGTYTHPQAGNGAILRSSNRGATFERVDLPFKLGGNELGRGNGERLAVDPHDGRILLFGTRRDGLWRSDDRGAHWREVTGFPAIAKSDAAQAQGWNGAQSIGVVFVEFDPASGQPGQATPRIYAGVSTQQTSLYVSDDGGQRWQAVSGQPIGLRPNHMRRGGDGAWYLSYGDLPGPDRMNNGAVWKYTPATGAWADITPVPQSSDGEGDGFGWGAVAVDPRDPQVLLASTFNRYAPHDDIYRSRDGGRSWVPVLARSDFDHSASPWTAHNGPHWIADIAINPYQPDEAMFVTGYGIWASRNLGAFDGGARAQWWFKDAGLEETVPLDLLSPREGAPLLSAVGDIDGFRHDDLDTTTLQYAGPRLTNGESIANAGQVPLLVVRTGTVRHRRNNEVRALVSRDGGASWSAFASEPPEGEGAGQVTVAADGKRVIWTPDKAGAWITADFGGRWKKVEGLPAGAVVAADRVAPAVYYAFDGRSGDLFVSGDGGISFARAGGVGEFGDWFAPEIHPVPDQAGVAYLTASWRGLLRWSAGKLVKLPGVENAYSMGLGAPLKAGGKPTIYLFGRVAGRDGLYRSDSEGRHWQRIDDDAHRFGKMTRVTGDPRRPGRVYFATGGRGIVYGDPR